MIGRLLGPIEFVLGIYNLVVIAHLVITLLRVPSNKWTEMLRSIVEPALKLVRPLLDRFFPQEGRRGFDWSPVALVVIIWVIQLLL